ncbi:MAG: ribosomal protein S18-alanine N-acetyltransferase [Anaerostipes sp.]|nr:ribosomal protein S18-alanine N-acetyltransferase [Anaerostipes sp.]MDD3747657.1 ribosomal protein S18-alanine N-acetyltransferase [Anaerostipes sp.]
MNRIKEVTGDDIEEIAKLEADCFSDPWSQKGIWDAYNGDFYLMYKIEEKEKIAGYIIGRYIVDEGELLRVAVNPKERQSGLGQALVQMLQNEMSVRGVKDIFLEVRESNENAIKLYEKMQFECIGKRKRYYQHPTEDAVLMKWKGKIC